jgi:FkbM family methyltransferase
MRLGHELLLDLRSGTEFHAYYTGHYDTAVIRKALRLLRPHSVVLDVGANIGFWSVPLARHLKEGCLHAFEPVPANVRRLAENVRRNGVGATVHLHQLGLSDQNGLQQISLREDFVRGAETGNAAIVIDSEDLRFSCIKIKVSSLDHIFSSLGLNRVDFIKVDIEGHEDRFLAGAANVIRDFRPILYLEINESYYQRRGLDATALFEDWLHLHSYRSAVCIKGQWCLEKIRNRLPAIDNIFFFPSEIAPDCIGRMVPGR